MTEQNRHSPSRRKMREPKNSAYTPLPTVTSKFEPIGKREFDPDRDDPSRNQKLRDMLNGNHDPTFRKSLEETDTKVN